MTKSQNYNKEFRHLLTKAPVGFRVAGNQRLGGEQGYCYSAVAKSESATGGLYVLLAIGVGVLVRVGVGILLLLAGWAKLASNPRLRQEWLSAYGLVPSRMLPTVAWTLPIAEVTCGSAILLGAFGSGATWSATILLTIVTGAVAATLLRGYRPPCGCMGKVDRRLIDWPLVMRNLILITCVAVASWFRIPSPGIGDYLAWPLQAAALLAVVVFISVAALRGQHAGATTHEQMEGVR